jgi:hypothetical protein
MNPPMPTCSEDIVALVEASGPRPASVVRTRSGQLKWCGREDSNFQLPASRKLRFKALCEAGAFAFSPRPLKPYVTDDDLARSITPYRLECELERVRGGIVDASPRSTSELHAGSAPQFAW